eukprot:Rmarinus@m.2691
MPPKSRQGKRDKKDEAEVPEDEEALASMHEEILEELIDTALKKSYDRYIQKQCIPYAVDRFLGEVRKLADIFFLPHDTLPAAPPIAENDETGLGAFFHMDEEPARVPPDTWARSAVPLRRRFHIPVSSLAGDAPQTHRSTRSGQSSRSVASAGGGQGGHGVISGPKPPQNLQEVKETMCVKPVANALPEKVGNAPDLEEVTLRHEVEERIRTEKLRGQKLKDALKEDEAFARYSRDLKGKEYGYDHNGQICFLHNMNPERLPAQCIPTRTTIAQEGAEQEKEGARKSNRPSAVSNDKKKKKKGKKTPLVSISQAEPFFKELKSIQPPMTNTIRMVSGVTVREGSNVKAGPVIAADKNHMSRSEYLSLSVLSTTDVPNAPQQLRKDSLADGVVFSVPQPQPSSPQPPPGPPLAAPRESPERPDRLGTAESRALSRASQRSGATSEPDWLLDGKQVDSDGHERTSYAREEFDKSILDSTNWGANTAAENFVPRLPPPRVNWEVRHSAIGTVSRLPRSRPFVPPRSPPHAGFLPSPHSPRSPFSPTTKGKGPLILTSPSKITSEVSLPAIHVSRSDSNVPEPRHAQLYRKVTQPARIKLRQQSVTSV